MLDDVIWGKRRKKNNDLRRRKKWEKGEVADIRKPWFCLQGAERFGGTEGKGWRKKSEHARIVEKERKDKGRR